MMGEGVGIGLFQGIIWIVSALLWIVPMWRIMGRTGQAPAVSLVALVPAVGVLIVMFVIAYGRWSRDNRAGAGA